MVDWPTTHDVLLHYETCLTEDIFPIDKWNNVAEKLDYMITYNDIKIMANTIEHQNNEETKDILIYNFNNIIKQLLNNNQSFKYNSGKNIIENYVNFMKKIGKSENEIDDFLKNRIYENKEVSLKNSGANFWKTYLSMNEIENNKDKIIEDLKKFNVNDFFKFIMETDIFVKYSNKKLFSGKRNIESLKINKLREMIIIMEDNILQKEFFPTFLEELKKFEKICNLNQQNKEDFNFLILELEKGLHCLTLTSKLNTNKIDGVKEKKIKI